MKKNNQPTINKQDSPKGSAIDSREKLKSLITKIKDGDQHAFTALVKQYRNQVAALAYKMVNDYDMAADIAQIVFVKISNNVCRYDTDKNFYTWLYRITINAAIDYMRKHKRHHHEPLENYHTIAEKQSSNPEFSYQRQKIKGYINQASQTLNEKQRSAFILRDIEGCKIDDVAEIMNIPEATARWYLHRARNKIRKELTRRCPQLLLLLGIKII